MGSMGQLAYAYMGSMGWLANMGSMGSMGWLATSLPTHVLFFLLAW